VAHPEQSTAYTDAEARSRDHTANIVAPPEFRHISDLSKYDRRPIRRRADDHPDSDVRRHPFSEYPLAILIRESYRPYTGYVTSDRQ
jgi:hypothetical protein